MASARCKCFEIEARDLCYHAPTSMGRTALSCSLWESPFAQASPFTLKHVSFVACPGELLAIAGPSGAGKSTLLELLAGHTRPTSGCVLVNKQTMTAAMFRRISSFVPQSDSLFPRLTVRETLMFSACLRLPATMLVAEKVSRVDALILELGLLHVADARVGGEGVWGVSGGERRRVSIGVEVVHDPSILLLDEPTSGLDSASALHIIRMLHSMAKMNSRTIMLSIHQPSYRIMQQINSFLLLANGAVVHHGPLQMLEYRLLAQGHTMPPHLSILDCALEAISSRNNLPAKAFVANKTSKPKINPLDSWSMPIDSEENDEPLHTKFTACMNGIMQLRFGLKHDQLDNEPSVTMSSVSTPRDVAEKPSFANSNGKEIMILSQRFCKNLLRMHKLVMSGTLQALAAGIVLGSVYMNVGMDAQGVRKRSGFFAFTLTYLMATMVEVLPMFLQERHVLERETSRGAYRVSSSVIANLLVFIPVFLLLALLYSLPAYFMIGLSNAPSAFLRFVLIVWLVLLMGNSCVAVFSVLAAELGLANSLIAGCMGMSFLFSGYFISGRSMPVYWRFMHYLSFFKYPLDALIINEYSSLQAQGKCFTPPPPLTSTAPCSIAPSSVLLELGLHQTHMWDNVAIMVAFLSTFSLLYYTLLKIKVSRRKS